MLVPFVMMKKSVKEVTSLKSKTRILRPCLSWIALTTTSQAYGASGTTFAAGAAFDSSLEDFTIAAFFAGAAFLTAFFTAVLVADLLVTAFFMAMGLSPPTTGIVLQLRHNRRGNLI